MLQFDQWGIFAIQTCLISQVVLLRSIITIKLINTNQFKLSSFYFIEFKEKSKKVIKIKRTENSCQNQQSQEISKTWTPAHQKSQNHRKNDSVLHACKFDPGLLQQKIHQNNHHNHQSSYSILSMRKDDIQWVYSWIE